MMSSYNVYGLKVGPEGNAGDSWHTEPVRISVEAWSQGGQG